MDIEQQLDAELRFDYEQRVAKNVASGMTEPEARRAARLEFGGIEQVKEECRDARGLRFFHALSRDVGYALRGMRRAPGFTIAAAAMLCLGIGANTAIFTVVYAALLAPSPYPDSDRLVTLWSGRGSQTQGVSPGDFADWKQQSTSFDDLSAATDDNFNIATRDRPEFLDGMRVTPGHYGVPGITLSLGRNFRPEEGQPGKDHVVILTHRLWLHLGGNLKVVGHTMQINGDPWTIVGVLASGATDRWDQQLIVPLVFEPEQLRDHASRYWNVTGRLKPGVTVEQARAEMKAISAREANEYPATNRGWSALVEPYRHDRLPADIQLKSWLLLGAAGLLLLLACLNIANLLLAKSMTRNREVAIRGSLGATPAAILSQFLTESALLAILGGVFGVVSGYAILRGLIAAIPPGALPAEADLRLNVPVLLVMLAVTTLAGFLFGSAPAWYASRLDPAGLLKEGGRAGTGVARQRLRRFLVIVEFALALPLLACAGLTVHSLSNLTRVDLGVRTDHLLGFYLDSVPLERNPTDVAVYSYYHRILASIRAVPGVTQASAVTYLPLDIFHLELPFSIAGRPDPSNPSLRPDADRQAVTPEYFETFGIRIVKGRRFDERDNASGARVAMVNETFVDRFLGGVDPLAQQLIMGPSSTLPVPPIAWQIVGVFHTVKSRGSREDNPEIDTPFWQDGSSVSGIGIRTATDPRTLLKGIASAVAMTDPQAALYRPLTLEQVHDAALADDRFTVMLFTSFGALALTLAGVGIYGMIAFSVTQRTSEIALRLALGATPGETVSMIVTEGLLLAAGGLAVGLSGAYFSAQAMRKILFGLGTTDLSTLEMAALVLLTSALFACYIPARKATRANPMAALRHE